MLKNRFVLGSIAPRSRSKENTITQAFQNGLISLSPASNWGLSRWQLRHEPTGGILAEFDRADLRIGRLVLAQISGWDWRGSTINLIPRATRLAWSELKADYQLEKSTSDIQLDIVKEMKQQRGMR